jgi:dTDP-4-amino-4,6-dideoxygalactose transaminase
VIPILNLTRQYDRLKDRIDNALLRVAASGHYILGPEVQAFEKEMAEYLGVKHVVGCANGTDALFLALAALKIGEGDEVITTPFSFMATSEAIARTGARPVFVDIDPISMNLDSSLLEAALTPKTRAIMPVHLFGQPANLDAIMAFAKAHKLAVVEDCAQSIGGLYGERKTGAIGDVGCFSFFPSKNLGAFGDGGMCSTNDDTLAERLRMLRAHGSRKRYYHDEPGLNSRLDEIQAAVLRIKLPHLEEWTHARRAVADYYDELLAPLTDVLRLPARVPDTRHVFHQYTVQIRGAESKADLRDDIRSALEAADIQSMVYYPVPLYSQGTHANLNINPADYPVCERLSAQVLSLPMFPELQPEEQRQVAQVLTETVKRLVPVATR